MTRLQRACLGDSASAGSHLPSPSDQQAAPSSADSVRRHSADAARPDGDRRRTEVSLSYVYTVGTAGQAALPHDVNGKRRGVFGLDDFPDRERFGELLVPGVKSVPDGGC